MLTSSHGSVQIGALENLALAHTADYIGGKDGGEALFEFRARN